MKGREKDRKAYICPQQNATLEVKKMDKKGRGDKEKMPTIFDIAKMVERDPKVKELAEEDQRKYGTLTEDDLKKVFTI